MDMLDISSEGVGNQSGNETPDNDILARLRPSDETPEMVLCRREVMRRFNPLLFKGPGKQNPEEEEHTLAEQDHSVCTDSSNPPSSADT